MDLVDIGKVGDNRVQRRALCVGIRTQCSQARLAARAHRHRRASAGEGQRHASADAPGAAGDEHAAAGEIECGHDTLW